MDIGDLKPGYEAVFTVTEYYDGPRQGIANYQGKPHYYDCIFDEEKGNYSDLFLLTPIEDTTFDLAMQDWSIWQKWEMAYHTGKASLDTHAALPEDAAHSAELKRRLDKALVTNSQTAIRLAGKFEVREKEDLPKGVMRSLQVKWVRPENS